MSFVTVLRHSRLNEQKGALAALLVSFLLSGCTLDAALLYTGLGKTVQINVDTAVGCALAGGGLYMAAVRVSPQLQRLTLAVAMTAGTFFLGTLSPQFFLGGFSSDGPLLGDIPDTLVVACLCVAGFFVIFRQQFLFRNRTAPGNSDLPETDHNAESLLRTATGHQQASATWRRSESTYEDTLDLMSEGCRIIGFDGRYRYVNTAAMQQGCQSRAALVGRTVQEAHPGIETTDIFAKGRRCMEDRIEEHSESEILCADGTRRWFQVNILPTPQGITVFTLEITDRKQDQQRSQTVYANLEHRLARPEEQRPATALMAVPSRDLGLLQRHSTDTEDALVDKRWAARWAKAEQSAQSSAFSMLRVVDDMQGLPEFRPALHESIEHTERACDTLFPASMPMTIDHHIELSLFIGPHTPPQIGSDPTRLRQILFSLTANAIKFSAVQMQPAAIVRIGLAGGMQPQLAWRVAEPDIRTSGGLASCMRFFTRARDKSGVQSAPLEASSFTVTLPVEFGFGTGAAVSEPDLGGLDCIVVGSDDDCNGLKTYLEQAGARVHPVGDVETAVRVADDLSHPVVIRTTQQEIALPVSVPSAFAPLASSAQTTPTRHLLIVRARMSAPLYPPPKPWTLPTLANAHAPHRLILIAPASDEHQQQQTLLRQVQWLGYEPEIATDSTEALRLWCLGACALLLTSLHMPEPAALRAACGNDPQVLCEFVLAYLASVRRWMVEFRPVHVTDGTRPLETSSRLIAMTLLDNLCFKLEMACLAETPDDILPALAEFDLALLAVDPYCASRQM